MLTRPQKSPTSFDSFEKDSSLRLRPRGDNAGGSLIVTHYSKKRSIVSNLPPSSEKWISVAHEVIVQLILPWPCSRPQLLETLETISLRRLRPKPCRFGVLGMSFLKRPNTSPYTPRIHIPRGPRMARPPIRRLGRRRRESSVVERLSKGKGLYPRHRCRRV